jgi:prepilin-type processing-associated H-X9-DG protein
MPVPLYHITHIDNIISILQSNGLLANSRLQQERTQFRDISYENIQGRRATKTVPCGVGGVLHDYVPFYFAPRSPMLYTIHKGNVPNYQGGQASVLHLVTTVEAIEAAGLNFAFTDGHAVMAYSDFYENLEDLERIDWDVMESRLWYDTNEDPNRKCKRQAEFLIHSYLPWNLVQEIGVINDSVRERICQILQNFGVSIPVRVYPNWYY